METREETEAREQKLVDDTKKLAQSGLRKIGINIQNPLAGLDAFGEPEYDEVDRRENWAGPLIKDISIDVLSSIAIGKVPQKSLVPKLPPRSDEGRMINVTPKRANEIVTSIIDGRAPKGGLTDFTTGSLKPNSMFSPNYRPPNVMYSTGVGDGGFAERLGKKIFKKKTEQSNIFTDPKTKRALPGMAGFKASMDNDIEAFAMDLFSKGKSGYKSLGAFRAKIINKLSDKDKYQILAEGDNLKNGYIEHMVQKSPAMNWYWKMKNQDRDGLQNVRMAFDTRLKTLKDVAEGIVHGRKLPNGKFKKGLGWKTDTLEDRIIVSFEDPDKHSFVFNKTGLGNIVLRRAGSNKLLGKLGQYLTTLYPQDKNIAAELDSNISNYIAENNITITVKTASGKEKTRLVTSAEWKRKFLENRVQLIIEEAPGLSGMDEAERNRFIDDEINKDMIQLRQEFTWLPQEQTNPLTEVEAGSDVFDYDKQPSGIPELGSKPVQGGPFKDFPEQDTTKIKGTGRVEQKSLFDQISDIIDHKE